MNKHFHLISLGCPKNRVDSERILSVMSDAGYLHGEEPSEAQIIIVNTCAFIEAAVEESINTILDFGDEFPDAFLVVAGCLPMRYGDEARAPLPEVDLFVTHDQIDRLPSLIAATRNASRTHRTVSPPSTSLRETQGRVLTTPGYTYLKIAEGCSRRCHYCTIPSIRGPLASAQAESLEREARSLAAAGVRELVLVAQDLGSYGKDRKERAGLMKLLRRLEAVEGIAWIRLMYLHPESIPGDLGPFVRDSAKVLPYLDIPFQHIADRVLKAMGRPAKGDRIRQLVDKLRAEIPRLVLRTTFMVGFPAEGEDEFRELLDFVKSYAIEHVGVFAYSPEEGTPAQKLGDPVSEAEKAARLEQIRAVSAHLQEQRNRARIGTVEPCIVEGVSRETELLLEGRTWDQAPEVDGLLYITSGAPEAWQIHSVTITDAHGPDLFGEIDTSPQP